MDTSNKTIDDYLKEGNKADTEVLKAMAKLNLFDYLNNYKRSNYDNRNKVQHRR